MSIDRLRRFIADMTSLTGGAWQDKDEAAIVEVGGRLLAELVRHDDWLPESMARVPPHGYAQNLLWCDPFERFCIVSFVWAPSAVTPVHDHEMWGLVGMLRGSETSLRFARDPATGALVAGRADEARARRCRGAAAGRGRHPSGDERAHRPGLDQHPCLWRQHRRRAAAYVRRQDGGAQALRVGLHQPRAAQPVGPLGGGEGVELASLFFLHGAGSRACEGAVARPSSQASACEDVDESGRPSRPLRPSRPG